MLLFLIGSKKHFNVTKTSVFVKVKLFLEIIKKKKKESCDWGPVTPPPKL
jgi:hypothetical protein